MKISFIESSIPSEILALLGEISINFAFLGKEVLSIICSSTSVEPNIINRLVGRDNFESLISKFNNSLIYSLDSKKLLTEDLHDELNKIVKKLSDIKEDRNLYTHSWIYRDSKGNLMRLAYKSRVKKDKIYADSEILTEQKLIKLNTDIINIIDEVFDFETKILGLITNYLEQKYENDQNETENQKET